MTVQLDFRHIVDGISFGERKKWSYIQRFEFMTNSSDVEGCHLWRAATDKAGYAVFNSGKRAAEKAYRWIWEYHNGPIPEGLDVDHVCHSWDDSCHGGPSCTHRRCVRLDHLEVVTPRVNNERSFKTRSLYCPAGHLLAGDNLRVSTSQRQMQRVCKQCAYERGRQWRKENRDHFNEYKRAWRAKRKRLGLPNV